MPWYLLYQPIGFKVGNIYYEYNKLIELFNKGKELDIKIIVDVVLNHVAGKNTGELKPHEKVDKQISENEHFFKDSFVINDFENREEIIKGCIGLPCLRLDNYQLQDIIIKFLNELIDMGADGFRIDAGKHIALPREGSDFFIRVLESLKRKDLFNYTEVIFSSTEMLEEYAKYTKVLTESFELEEEKSINFIESHDTFLEFKNTEGLDNEEIILRYKNMCEKRKNTLFYARPFNNLWTEIEIKNINYNNRIENI